MLCTAYAAVNFDNIHSLDSNSLQLSTSQCRREVYNVFQRCLDNLAQSKAVRDICAKFYLTIFPKCYFKAGESSYFQILKLHSKCVKESSSDAEKLACFEAIRPVETRIRSTVSDVKDSVGNNYIKCINRCNNLTTSCKRTDSRSTCNLMDECCKTCKNMEYTGTMIPYKKACNIL